MDANPYAPDPRAHAAPGTAPRVTDLAAEEWERTYSLFTHLSTAITVFLFIPVIPALIMWLIKRDRSPFVDDHGKEALNFQISLLLYAVGFTVLGALTCGVGWFLLLPLYALAIVGMILAAIAANKGQYYRYPMTVRLVR